MKCEQCGFESQEEFKFCGKCGAAAPVIQPVSLNPVEDKVLAALRDKLFLVICILMTVASVFSFASEGLPVINILITVFLWLTYSNSCKGIADVKFLRCISGTVYASYVITNVAAIILIVCGVILTFALGILTGSTEFADTITSGLGGSYGEYTGLLQGILAIAGWLVGIILVIIAVAWLIINVLGMRKIHRFAQSVYQGIITQNPEFANPHGTKNWLIFFGVCSGVSAVGSLLANFIAALSSGCSAAAIIIAVILINKHFIASEYK